MDDHQKARAMYHSSLEIGVASQATWLCLSVLTELASLYESTGNPELAVDIATLVESHPNTAWFWLGKTKKLIDKLATKLPVEIFTEAQDRGRKRDVLETAEEMLALLEREDLDSDIGS
jgi:hypothetical protein